MTELNGILKLAAVVAALIGLTGTSAIAQNPPKAGDTAPDFSLKTLDGKSVSLKQLTSEKPVVLIVLRGWPGYQCPLCSRQVQEFSKRAADFDAKGATVLMVYPGPADNLKAHAEEFLADKNWPKSFYYVLDPDFTFTKTYHLRWDAKNETAYPSSFVIDKAGKVHFAHVSNGHGDRVKAETALKALEELAK